MIRNVLEQIGGIAAYPLFSLVLFVLVFSGAIVVALTMRRSEVERMSQLPLSEDHNPAPTKESRR